MSRNPAPAQAPRALTELWAGFRTLWIGFSFWKRTPRLMWLGLLPGAIAGAILLTGIVLLVVFLDPLVSAITPFAHEWDALWRNLVRVTVGIAIVITAGVLSARVFSALALTIGEPIYERICRDVDDLYGLEARPQGAGFWQSLSDMGGVVARSIGGSLVIFLISLIPAVGAALGTVLGVLLTASVITREFTLLPFQMRGLDGAARNAVLGRSRMRRLGFGLAVQLCYLVPGGAVLAMPCAVAGGTRLARELLGEPVAVGAVAPAQDDSNRPVSD